MSKVVGVRHGDGSSTYELDNGNEYAMDHRDEPPEVIRQYIEDYAAIIEHIEKARSQEVERLAKAMHRAYWEGDFGCDWDNSQARDTWRRRARALLDSGVVKVVPE